MIDDDLIDDLTLVPADEPDVSAEEELEAAVLSALEDPFAVRVRGEPPIPYGRTWAFDHVKQRFIRSSNGSPVEVRGEDALVQWIQNALATAAGAHEIFSPSFGLEDPNDFIGLADPREALSDFRDRVQRALLEHERIASVEGPDTEHISEEGVIYVRRLIAITDEEESVGLLDFEAAPEV